MLAPPGGPGLDPTNGSDAALDFDLDGLINLDEFNLGTNIFLDDTDADGIDDADEQTFGSNPLLPDSDGDGLLDGNEVDPQANADGDGLINILDPDADNDGLPDGIEFNIGLDSRDSDSDNRSVARRLWKIPMVTASPI